MKADVSPSRARLLFPILLLIFSPYPALSEPPGALEAPQELPPADLALRAESLVNEWFIRLNGLDDWYISVNGDEETEAVVDHFVDLYSDDAYHQVSPSERQIGQVVFHGHDGIRKWADDFAKSRVGLEYRRDFATRREQTTRLVYSTVAPWGGTGAAVEFTAVYTNRQDRRRMIVPGSVFFLFDEAGKIERLRLYMLVNETAEIGP